MEDFKEFFKNLKLVACYDARKKQRKNIIACLYYFKKYYNKNIKNIYYISDLYEYLLNDSNIKNKDMMKIIYDDFITFKKKE